MTRHTPPRMTQDELTARQYDDWLARRMERIAARVERARLAGGNARAFVFEERDDRQTARQIGAYGARNFEAKPSK